MILITGGSGFIGKNVCSALQARHDVLALDAKRSDLRDGSLPAKTVLCDLSDEDAVARVFADFPIDTIVHLASVLKTASSENPRLASEVNVRGSVNLFEAARKVGVKRIVYGSSITVYGLVPDAGLRGVSEEYPAAPEDVYGGSKRYVEIVGAAYQNRGGFDFVAARIASVIGPGSASASSPWRSGIFEKLRHTRAEIDIPFSEDQALPLVHIDDVVEMVVRLVEAKRNAFSVYNSPSQTWTFGEMARHVAAVNPGIEFVFGQSKIVGHPHKTDASRFIREFGFRSVPLEERLQRVDQKAEEKF